MKKKKIVYIVGTRPEIIRSAIIINKFRKDPEVDFKLLHTGQHYNYLMDKVFFEELNVSPPDFNLKVGSKTPIQQTVEIMEKTGKFFSQYMPDMVIVFGDTSSTLAGALVAVKMDIALSHIEAGFREWEMYLPEEINRRLTDHCSNLLFPLSKTQVNNLKSEKVLGDAFNFGDPQFEVFDFYFQRSIKTDSLNDLPIKDGLFILLTIHRNINVDNTKRLISILTETNKASLPVIFPIHPRTKKQLESYDPSYDKKFSNIFFINPLSYFSLLTTLNKAELVITDSGGLIKEVFWAKKPCITLKKYTGWVETVESGVNFPIDPDDRQVLQTIESVLKNKNRISKIFQKVKNPYYKKDSSDKIIKKIKQYSGKSW